MFWSKQDYGIGNTRLGRWLGVVESTVSLMIYWVLQDNGVLEVRTTVQRVTETEKYIDEHINKFKDYDDKIFTRFK